MKNEFKIGDLVYESRPVFNHSKEVILEVVELKSHKLHPTKIICRIKGESNFNPGTAYNQAYQYFFGEITLRKDLMRDIKLIELGI